MNHLFQAALEVQDFLLSRRWRFCFIGGLAVLRWGEARMTRDVDISLFVGFGDELPFIQTLLRHYYPRIDDAEDFALKHRVLLVQNNMGIPLDIALAGLPFEEQVIIRSSYYSFQPGCDLLTCSAEDLLVFKAFAARSKDWGDVEGVLTRQAGKLDAAYVFKNLTPLAEAKEAPEILQKMHVLLEGNP